MGLRSRGSGRISRLLAPLGRRGVRRSISEDKEAPGGDKGGLRGEKEMRRGERKRKRWVCGYIENQPVIVRVLTAGWYH